MKRTTSSIATQRRSKKMIRRSWILTAAAFALCIGQALATVQDASPSSGLSAALQYTPATVNLVAVSGTIPANPFVTNCLAKLLCEVYFNRIAPWSRIPRPSHLNLTEIKGS
jgi:hypothetical protein